MLCSTLLRMDPQKVTAKQPVLSVLYLLDYSVNNPFIMTSSNVDIADIASTAATDTADIADTADTTWTVITKRPPRLPSWLRAKPDSCHSRQERRRRSELQERPDICDDCKLEIGTVDVDKDDDKKCRVCDMCANKYFMCADYKTCSTLVVKQKQLCHWCTSRNDIEAQDEAYECFKAEWNSRY